MADTQLAPGQYNVTWNGTGPVVSVNFTQGKKTLATGSAILVSLPASQPEAVVTYQSGSVAVLSAIELNHLTIHFDPSLTANGD